jgi:hypothetical protein
MGAAMHAKVHVQAGICGFVTEIEAKNEGDIGPVQFTITSTCKNISRLSETLREIDSLEEIGLGFEGKILSAARARLAGCCAGCVVPIAVFKAMQVAAGLALPKDVLITVQK